MSEPKLRAFGALRLPVFIRVGAPCPDCLRVFRNEQGLAGHRYHQHGRRGHA